MNVVKKRGRPPKISEAQARREKWAEKGATTRTENKIMPSIPKPPGRPKGSMNKTREVAEALLGYNGNRVVREILRKALDPNDKDQAMMLKCCLERILPPVREVNIKSQKQTAINVIVEGVQSFVKEAIEGEVIPELIEENLEVEGTLPEEAYADIIEEEEE